MFNNHRNVRVKVEIPENTNIEKISEFDKIIFSPGPGISTEVPFMNDIMKLYHKTHPILGVCLGFQAISLHFGGSIRKLENVNHGKRKKLKILDKNSKLYQNIHQNSGIGLYHSWVLNKHDLPDCIKITGECENGNIMSIEHQNYPLYGVQFHPESFVTEYGKTIIDNWIKI